MSSRATTKRIFGLMLTAVLIIGISAGPVAAGGIIKVMTRNLYLGADFIPIVLAEDDGQFIAAVTTALTTAAVNNFPLRAKYLAKEVAYTRPDVIALQEVFNFTVNGFNGEPPFVDHLKEFLKALAAKGQYYKAAARVEHLDVTLLFDVTKDGIPDEVRVVDSDVILVRKGIKYKRLDNEFDKGGLCGVPVDNPIPFPNPFPDTFISAVSEDGCNFTAAAKVEDTLIGDITVERGFVGIDARVRGKKYRIVDTHLEVKLPNPNMPESAILQSLQAYELMYTLLFTTPTHRKLILLGDFNSDPMDPAVTPVGTPYQIISAFGYTDIWNTNLLSFYDPEGLTCCQNEWLSNINSELIERVDLIFVNKSNVLPFAFVTGNRRIFPLSSPPNWASDHSGVFAKLFFGLKRRW